MVISVPIQVLHLPASPISKPTCLAKVNDDGVNMTIKSIKDNFILMKVIVNETKIMDQFDALCTFELNTGPLAFLNNTLVYGCV